MGRAYGTYVRFWKGNLKGRDCMGGLGIAGKIICKWMLKEIVWESMNWSNVAQDRDKWQAVESGVMNCQVPYNVVNFLTR